MLLLRKLTWCMVMVILIHGAVDAVCPPELDDIQLEPQHAVIGYGDPVSVNCNTSSNVTRLSWTGPPEHVQWDDHSQTATWKMDALTDWDIQMVCYVNSSDVQCNRTLPLIIYKTPDNVSISIVAHSGSMIEDNQYELQCDIQNVAPVQFLTVKWFKGQTVVNITSYYNLTKTPVNLIAKLQITPSRDDDGIEYSCEAELVLKGSPPLPKMTSGPLTFTVHYAPDFDCPSVYEEREHNLFHNCTVVASPVANVSWYKDGVEVEPPHNLTRRDNGFYRITAWNEHGSAHHNLNISVLYGPEIESGESSVEVYKGRSVSLSCTAEGNPEPEVMWIFPNQTKATGGRQTTLTFSPTSVDGGEYTCAATNKIGIETRKVTVVVKETPDHVSISTVGHSEPMTEDEQYELQCDIQNVAPVQFLTVKLFQGESLVANESFTNLNPAPVNQTVKFQITPGREDNGTEYRCQAELNLGPDGPHPPPTVTSDPLTIIMQRACPLTLQPPEVVVEHGASASANCSTTEPHKGIGWEAPQGQVDMTDRVQLITWYVENLTVWDIKPVCFINVDETEPCRRDLLVTVYKTPDSVSINVMNHFGPMTEDKQYTLRCVVQNVAPVQLVTVKWFKGVTLVENTSTKGKRTQNIDTLTPKLQITPSRHDNGIEYRCEAELDLGKEGPQPPPTMSSEPLTIVVNYKPAIKCSDWAPLVNTSLNTRSNTVMGNPTPHISWFQGRSLVDPSTSLSKDDSGEYEYIASNKIGNASCITKITVEYAPEFVCPSVYEEREHNLFHNCTVVASPVASVSWYKDGVEVEPPHSLTRRDNGSYIINARNKHGTVDHHLTISVLYGPEIESGESSVEVYKGRSVSLPCTAEGNPEPEVMWIFPNQTKATGGRQTTLTFSPTSVDGGEYTCTATNKIGIETRKVTVVVKDYLILIISVSLIVLLIIIIFAILAVYVTRRRTGKYDVQCNGEAHSMALLNENTHG